MRDKPVPDVLINHHRDTLKTLWDTTMQRTDASVMQQRFSRY
jgi:hypothetical protein